MCSPDIKLYLLVTKTALTGVHATLILCGIQTLIARSTVTQTRIQAESAGAKNDM